MRGLLGSHLAPDLDKGLCLGVTPRETFFFQCVGAATPTLSPFHRPFSNYASIGEWVKNGRGRINLDRKPTEARRDVRRGRGYRRHLAGLLFIRKQHGEPSLDTPNTRPFSASSQGPKLAHGKPLTAR